MTAGSSEQRDARGPQPVRGAATCLSALILHSLVPFGQAPESMRCA